MCIVTNWASLYKHITFAACKQVAHLPLMKPEKIRSGGSVCVIFQATEKQLGLCMQASSEERLASVLTSDAVMPFEF